MKTLKEIRLGKVLMLVCASLISINLYGQEQKREEFTVKDGSKFYWVKSDDGWGIEDASGKEIVPKVYDKIQYFGNLIYCEDRKDKKVRALYNFLGDCKVFDNDGFNYLHFFVQDGKYLASACDYPGEKQAVFDENGDLKYLFEGKEYTYTRGTFCYLRNELSDEFVINPHDGYQRARVYSDYIETETWNGKKGVVNFDGSLVIPAEKYKSISPIMRNSENVGFYVWISSGEMLSLGTVGVIDRKGNCVIPAEKYTSIKLLTNGFFKVIENGRAGIVDSLGNVKFMTNYQDLILKKDEEGQYYYETIIGNGKGKIDLKGEEIELPNPTREENIIDHYWKYIEVQDVNGLVGVKDINGNMLIPCEFDKVHESNGLIKGYRLDRNGFQGFADLKGKIIIPCGKYHYINVPLLSKDGDYFVVEFMGREGLCDKNGNEIIKPIYDKISFNKNYVKAMVGNMVGILDFDGNVVIPFEYTSVVFDKDGYYKVELFDKVGVCYKDGSMIVPARYSSVLIWSSYGEFKEPMIQVWDGKYTGLYTPEGKMIFPASLFENVYICKGPDAKNRFSANKYIMAYNRLLENVCYYDLDGNLLYDQRQDKIFDTYFTQGGEEFDLRNYKKAIDYYKKALSVRQDGRAYYNIGAAYYNMGKYRDAIKNLQSCTTYSNIQSITDKANDLILECKLCMQEKRQRNAAVWLDLLGTALNVAATVAQSNQALSNYNSNLRSGGNNTANLDYLVDPRYTMMQVQRQNWNEYLQMTNGGTSMSYNEYQRIKAQAWADSQGQSQSQPSSSSNASSETYHNRYEKHTIVDPCISCGGSGKCGTCNGKHWYYGIGGSKITCPNCDTDGHCKICNGSGKKTRTEWY